MILLLLIASLQTQPTIIQRDYLDIPMWDDTPRLCIERKYHSDGKVEERFVPCPVWEIPIEDRTDGYNMEPPKGQ